MHIRLYTQWLYAQQVMHIRLYAERYMHNGLYAQQLYAQWLFAQWLYAQRVHLASASKKWLLAVTNGVVSYRTVIIFILITCLDYHQ